MKGLYRGFWATFWRDVPSWAIYFAAFEWMKQLGPKYINKHNIKESQLDHMKMLWTINAGGMAGVLSWAACIPQDVIKSK